MISWDKDPDPAGAEDKDESGYETLTDGLRAYYYRRLLKSVIANHKKIARCNCNFFTARTGSRTHSKHAEECPKFLAAKYESRFHEIKNKPDREK